MADDTPTNGLDMDMTTETLPDTADPSSLDQQQPSIPPSPTVAASPQPPPSQAPLPVTATAPNIQRPDSMLPQPSARPDKPVAHGGPTRQYLNQNVTPHLLEAMKHLAAHEPEKPLAWLADFLRERSREVEG